MTKSRRLFPVTFKHKAVDRVVSSGLSPGKVALELGLHETVLRRWVKEAGVTATGSTSRPIMHALPSMPSDLAAENARVRREVERLRMEREILKKASPSSEWARSEVRVHPRQSKYLAHPRDVPGSGHVGQRLLCVARTA